MEVSVSHPYSCSADEVIANFFNEDKVLYKNEKLGCKNVDVKINPIMNEEGSIRVSRDVRASGEVPSALRSFHNEVNRITQTEEWTKHEDGSFICLYKVHIEGVPAKVTGKMHVIPADEGSVNHVSLRVDCKIPFLGKTVARFLAEDSRLKIEDEYRVIQQLINASV